MNIERHTNKSGELVAFSVDNRITSRNGMAKLVSKIPEIEIIGLPRFYDTDVFCEFLYGGHKFTISEPYEDGPTYDVMGPINAQIEAEKLALFFEKSKPIKGGDLGYRAFKLLGYMVIPSFLFLIFAATVSILKFIDG